MVEVGEQPTQSSQSSLLLRRVKQRAVQPDARLTTEVLDGSGLLEESSSSGSDVVKLSDGDSSALVEVDGSSADVVSMVAEKDSGWPSSSMPKSSTGSMNPLYAKKHEEHTTAAPEAFEEDADATYDLDEDAAT